MNRVEQGNRAVFFRKAMLWAGIAVAALGILGLLGWILHSRVVTAFGGDLVPMAPHTAAAFILFGVVSAASALEKLQGRIRALIFLLVGFTAAYGLLKFIELLTGTDLTFGNRLLPPTEMVNGIPAWHMSPITGLMLSGSGVALLLALWPDAGTKLKDLAAGMGVLVLGAAIVVASGYLFGAPLLYGSKVTPVAASTALGTGLLGIGLMAAAGRETMVARPFLGDSVRAKILRTFLPMIIAAAVLQGFAHEVVAQPGRLNGATAAALVSLSFAGLVGAMGVLATRLVLRSAEHTEQERKRAEKELAESEGRYRAIVNGAAEALVIVQGGKVVYANPKWQEMSGYSREETLGLDIKTLVHPDSLPMLLETERRFRSGMQGKGTYGIRIVAKSGDIRSIEANSALIEYNGKPATVTLINDVTERDKAQAKLKLQADALNAAANAIVITDKEGIIIWVNRAFTTLTGFEADEAIGNTPRILKSGVQGDQYYQKMWNTILSGKIWQHSLVNRRKDGTLYIEDQTINPVTAENGEIKHFVAIKQDLTESKRLHDGLELSQARLEEAQAITHVGNWERDLSTGELLWSDQTYRIWGLDPEEVTITLDLAWATLDKQDQGRTQATVRNAIKHREPYDVDFHITRPDGVRRVVNARGRATFDELGRATRIRGTVQDVTERRRSEGERLELAEVLDATSDLVIVGTPGKGNLTYVNRAAREMLGGDPNTDLFELFMANPRFDKTRAPLLDIALPAAERGGRWTGELSFRNKEGDLLWLSIVLLSHRRGDGTEYFSIVGRDITQQKESEKQIRESLAEKEVLVKEVHHRVKNNLQVLSSLMNLRAQQVDENTAKVLRDLQSRVLAMALIHEKLYQSEDFAEIDFARYLKDLLFQLALSYQARPGAIEVEAETKDISLPLDKAVPCALIVTELVSNSIKHAFPKGKGGQIKVRLSRENDQFVLLVRDNGIGLPEGRDLRASPTLGMKLVDALVRQLGGTLEISSNGGAAFRITWPAGVPATVNV